MLFAPHDQNHNHQNKAKNLFRWNYCHCRFNGLIAILFPGFLGDIFIKLLVKENREYDYYLNAVDDLNQIHHVKLLVFS